MRRILIDDARRHTAGKRGGEDKKLSLDDAVIISVEPDENLLALNRALEQLEALDPLQGRIIELRYFGGLSIEETAEALSLSPATVKREWAMARAWLYKAVTGEEMTGGTSHPYSREFGRSTEAIDSGDREM